MVARHGEEGLLVSRCLCEVVKVLWDEMVEIQDHCASLWISVMEDFRYSVYSKQNTIAMLTWHALK